MEKKKLQRVIGISVVVAFVIVLIPFLFGKKEMPQQETTAQVLPEQQSTTTATDSNQVTAANTATDPNQATTVQDNTNAVNPADPTNSSAQNTATSNSEDNGITPITTPPVASNDQNGMPATLNPADTNNQAATTPTQNATGQSTSAISPVINPVNPENSASAAAPASADNAAPAGDTVQVAPAVSTDTDDNAHAQATVEKTAATAPAKQVSPKHLHKSLVAKKASHVSEQSIANLKKPAWVVQMGSFKDKSNAHRLVNQLRTSGYKAFTRVVTSPAGNVRTRVYIGPEFKQASAQQLSTKVERQVKLQGIVMPYKPMAL